MKTYGAIEAGGTRWVCATVNDCGDVLARRVLPTTTPSETLEAAVAFFRGQAKIQALGIGAFGPLDLRLDSPSYGCITTTPKLGWAFTDVLSPFREALDVPVVLDTDVNAAAIGERRWGRAVGLNDFVYLTVGTGIGGGAFVNGKLLRGLQHVEMGHLRIPHDLAADPFSGSCPFHGDCFEGLASGAAMRHRWGRPAQDLSESRPWELEARYLALGLVNIVYTLAPERIIVGGGVGRNPRLLPLTRGFLVDLLGGYLDHPALQDGLASYATDPGLGDLSGVLGASEMAHLATVGGPVADLGEPS
jgi:fructokinase